MTTIDDLFPSPYLTAGDVEHKPVVTMKSVSKKTMRNRDGEEEVKNVLFFDEFEKGMVLNKTNADIIVNLHGRVIDDWFGEHVQLHSVMVEAFGKRTPAIRVVETKPSDKGKLLERYQALYERAIKANVEGVENYVISPNMTEDEIKTLGIELKAKVTAAEQF